MGQYLWWVHCTGKPVIRTFFQGGPVDAGKVDDATWQKAAGLYSREEMVELVLVAGFYSMVARVLDALRVELDDDIRDYAPRLPG